MFDGAELAKAIAASPNDVEAPLRFYEYALFARTETVAIESDGMLRVLLGENAPHSLLEFFGGNPPG